MVGEATIIGALVGIVIVLNRILITKLSPLFKNLYSDASGIFLNLLKVFTVVTLVGLIVGVMVKKEPMISGSGIPQLEGILKKKIKINWLKEII